MTKKTKMLLTIIGVAALVVPVLLLVFLTAKPKGSPTVPQDKRSLDKGTIEETVKKVVPKTPTPASASPSASPANREASPATR